MSKNPATNAEEQRLAEDASRERNWKRWGPYLSERQWGTVREDYSQDGDPWNYFPHDHARSRAYRWGEDGLLGISDREGRMAFALALWNGRDPILKERLFGLTGPEGNHGEDVKELYYYLDSTPTHSYLKALYKYPQAEFPYSRIVEENRHRGKGELEFELLDTGVFEQGYWDVLAEYANASPDDILIKITVTNRGSQPATLHLLPTLWFRNTWSWGRSGEGYWPKPRIEKLGESAVLAEHASLGAFRLEAAPGPDGALPQWLFSDNETNTARLYNFPNANPYVKDAFHRYLIQGETQAINPEGTGTKAAVYYRLEVPAGESATVWLRLYAQDQAPMEVFGPAFEQVFAERLKEADQFYAKRLSGMSPEEAKVARQAYAGLLWSKQFFHYSVKDWLEGDPAQPTPPEARKHGRNSEWQHLYNRDIISMPDKWEYPWFAAWDLAFHMIPFAKVDPGFAKDQLVLFLREWYQHPNGQIPAYEFAFGDVNPPVHAWAAWRVYKMSGVKGQRDRRFLERVFHKLLLNFTWWVNRKDPDGHNLFAGGFLGLDNIGVFDRSKPLPTGGHLEQADGTGWMAFYCSTMLAMALELADQDPVYEDLASKFFEHFMAIAAAINTFDGAGLWDEQDGFYYSRLNAGGDRIPMRIRSMVGLLPLIAVEVLEQEVIDKLPGFKKRMEWFLENRPEIARLISCMLPKTQGGHAHRLLAIPSRERLERVLKYLLDESEFLSDYGLRSVSRVHALHPYVFEVKGERYAVDYVPAEGNTGLFGGNSNWRGPIWMPVNYLLVEALERYYHFYGDDLKVEYPTGSGRLMNLQEVSQEIARRLTRIFLPGAGGHRPTHGGEERYARDPHWKDLVLFYEYFHGDTGRGVGASHQTGWTALVAPLLESLAKKELVKEY